MYNVGDRVITPNGAGKIMERGGCGKGTSYRVEYSSGKKRGQSEWVYPNDMRRAGWWEQL